jgi:membrane protease YdiL (CAAX protease family)
MRRLRQHVRARPLLAYLVTAVLLEGGVLLTRPGRNVTPFLLVLVPPVAAILTSALQGGWEDVRTLFARITRWRVAFRWYLAALIVPLVGTLVIVAIAILSGATSRPFAGLTPADAVVPAVVLLPGLLEEFGWRGYGVPAAMADGRRGLWAALIVGVVFTLAHLPLYLPGQLYDGLPLWPLPLILLSYSVLLTWVFLGTGGSSLLAGLTHASLNGWVPLTSGIDAAWVAQARAIVFVVIALVIITASRPLLLATRVGEPAAHMRPPAHM